MSTQKALLNLTARAVIFDKDKILLCYNLSGDYFVLPGGHVDAGERASACLSRELYEEFGVGCFVEPTPILLFEQCYKRVIDGNSALTQDYSLIFKVKLENGAVVVQKERHIKPVWVDLSKLNQLDFKPKELVNFLLKSFSIGTAQASSCFFISSESFDV